MRRWTHIRIGAVATGCLVAWLAVCAIAQVVVEPEAPAADPEPPVEIADVVIAPVEEPEVEAMVMVDVESPIVAEGVEVRWVKQLSAEQLDERSIVAMLPAEEGFYLLLGRDMKLEAFRFDEAGQEQWRRELPPEFSGSGAFLTYNEAGNLLVAGTAETPLVPTAGAVLNKVYIAELDAEGVILSEEKFSLPFILPTVFAEQLGVELEVTDIVWTPEGDAFIAGALWGQMGSKVQAVPFLARVDDRGEAYWSQLVAPDVPHLTSVDDAAFRVVISEDTILLAGSTRASLDGASQGGTDLFAVAYSNAGDMAWGKQYGSDGDDDLVAAYGDADGFTFMGTTSGDLADRCVGRSDGFILHCDSAGAWDWGVQSGERASDAYRTLLIADGVTRAASAVDGDLQLAEYDEVGDQTWTKSLVMDGLFIPTRVSPRADGTLLGWGRYFPAAGDDEYYDPETVIFCLEPSWSLPPEEPDEATDD